ncbi:MAG: hypothetical protein HQ517_08360 [SAR324 cluster bacterium]|nr:hypothetical protein [SAR324 cluster bacterium]
MASVFFGLVIVALGVWGLSVWWWSVAEFLRGFVPVALVIFGIIAIGAGITPKDRKVIENSSDESFDDTEF